MATFTTYRKEIWIFGDDFVPRETRQVMHDYFEPHDIVTIEWTDIEGCDEGCIRMVDIIRVPELLESIKYEDKYAFVFKIKKEN